MTKKSLLIFLSLLTLSLSKGFISPVSAIYFGSGENVYLSADNKFDETVMVAGNKITLDSNINGDLFCAGQDITINGSVTGDIFCAGQNLTINGKVDGNIRVAGQELKIDSIIKKNALAAGKSITFSDKSTIGQDALLAGETINIFSSIGRDLAAGGSNINLNSNVARNVLFGGEKLSSSKESKIGGNLEYYVSETSTVNLSGTVAGQNNKHLAPVNKTESKPVAKEAAFGGLKIFSILSTIVLSFAFLFFAKQLTTNSAKVISTRPVVTFFIGLSALFVTPIMFLILLVTIIGIPLAFVLILLYVIAIITSGIYVSLSVGQRALESSKIGGSDYLALLLGVVITQLVVLIPAIGWILGFVFLCLGMGGFTQNFLPVNKNNEVKKI